MVSQTPTQTEVNLSSAGLNRGFVAEETVVAVGPGNAFMYYRPFWRPVVAGTVFTLSVFVLSWYLMLGCHVGIDSAGAVVLGPGAAIWLWITAIIAFYFGGMIASYMTAAGALVPGSSAVMATNGSGWLKGAVLWGLSIPLALVVYGIMSNSGGMLADLSLPHLMSNTANGLSMSPSSNMGFYWATFITLGLGLVFAVIGGVSGSACGTTGTKIAP